MYEYIQGHLDSLSATQAVIDCGGVGYLLEISVTTYDKIQHLRDSDEPVRLLTHEVVREDAHLLYGFADEGERTLFRLLISVNGVGVNTARLMLSTLTAVELANAIASQDEHSIRRLKGIGAKTSQRIVMELHDKVKELSAVASGTTGVPLSANKEEATIALTMLGFAKPAIEKVLQPLDNRLTTEELIKQALKSL